MVRSADDRWVSWSLAESRLRSTPTLTPSRDPSGRDQFEVRGESVPRSGGRATCGCAAVATMCVGERLGVRLGGISRSKRLADRGALRINRARLAACKRVAAVRTLSLSPQRKDLCLNQP